MKQPRGYVCARAAGPVKITGRGDDPAWENAPVIDFWPDIRGEQAGTSPLSINAQLLWDDSNLYLFARMEELAIWSFETEHDGDLWFDNVFELFLDPDGDGCHYFEWEVNVRGVTLDMAMDRPYVTGGRRDDSLEIQDLQLKIVTDGEINNPARPGTFWSVEAAFPWTCLTHIGHSAPSNGDIWRFNLMKMFYPVEVVNGEYRKTGEEERYWTFAPTRMLDIHRPYMWGYLEFAEDASHAVPIDPDWETKFALVRALRLHDRLRSQVEFPRSALELGPGQEVVDHPSGFAIRSVSPTGSVWQLSADGLLRSM